MVLNVKNHDLFLIFTFNLNKLYLKTLLLIPVTKSRIKKVLGIKYSVVLKLGRGEFKHKYTIILKKNNFQLIFN